MAVILYNAATFDANNIEQEEGKLGIIEFVELYNQMYFFQTSRWVENRMEEYLSKSTLSEEELLQIFAWKIDRINMVKSQGEKQFYYTGEEKDKMGEIKWVVNEDKETATSSARRKIDPHELYVFLCKVKEKKEAYHNLKVELNNDIEREEKLFNQKYNILKELTNEEVLPKNIGSVYLLTFFYFITQGDEPIYDSFAMKALDAIYPDGGKKDSLPLGSPVIKRDPPLKNAELLTKCPYSTYKEKLCDFVDEYNNALKNYNRSLKDKEKTKKSVTCASREIDRALWVYGHFFQ